MTRTSLPSSPGRPAWQWLHPVGAALCLTLVAGGCRPEAPTVSATAALPAVKARVAPVELRASGATEEVVGTVRARLRAAVEAKVPGRIETVRVNPGQTVNAGELLLTLDAREAQARLDSAIAVREQTARDLERISKLVKDGAVTQADLDATEARHRVALASVSEAETFLGHTRVLAPFPGVITRKLADVGDLATPGRPLLEIEDPLALRFEADVPEALLERLEMGGSFPVRLDSRTNVLMATVSEVAPVADPVSRTFRVKLDLATQPGLRAGQFGRVAVPTGGIPVPQVPASAIARRGQMEYVWIIQEGRAQLRIVRTGKIAGDRAEVLSGVAPGESVVVDAALVLREGQPVEAP